MATISETGHAKNVANFEKMIINITGFGSAYNPSKENIKHSALMFLLTSAKEAISNVNSAEPALKNAIGNREQAYMPLGKLITRVNNSLKASASSSQIDDNVMTIIRKLQGRRATTKKPKDENQITETEGKETKVISTSQLSYDSRIDNLDKLIKLLSSIPEYSPNEPELTTAALTEVLNSLKDKNMEVINASVPLTNARIVRNHILYAPLVGMVAISGDIKNYVKSVYGATSPQYKALGRIRFTSPK